MTRDAKSAARRLAVTAVFSPASRQVHEHALELEVGCTVAVALTTLQQLPDFAALNDLPTNTLSFGIWGLKAAASQILQNGDRLEIYRPLRVDPKIARHLRFKGQGVKNKGAGLFAKRRDGAKAGY